MCGPDEAPRQQRNVEPQLPRDVVDSFFFAGQQVEQQRTDPLVAQTPCDEVISGAQPAAAAAMGEEHQTAGVGGHLE